MGAYKAQWCLYCFPDTQIDNIIWVLKCTSLSQFALSCHLWDHPAVKGCLSPGQERKQRRCGLSNPSVEWSACRSECTGNTRNATPFPWLLIPSNTSIPLQLGLPPSLLTNNCRIGLPLVLWTLWDLSYIRASMLDCPPVWNALFLLKWLIPT